MLTLYRENNCSWGKKERKKCLLPAVWQLKGIEKKTYEYKGRCPLCLGKEMSKTCYWIAGKIEI